MKILDKGITCGACGRTETWRFPVAPNGRTALDDEGLVLVCHSCKTELKSDGSVWNETEVEKLKRLLKFALENLNAKGNDDCCLDCGRDLFYACKPGCGIQAWRTETRVLLETPIPGKKTLGADEVGEKRRGEAPKPERGILWALENAYVLARRKARRVDADPDWSHIIRFAEEAGLRSSILRD